MRRRKLGPPYVSCYSEHRHADDYSRSTADSAFDLDSSALQFHAAFDDSEAQPRARHLARIASAVKGAEHSFQIRLRNAHALVPNAADRILVSTLDIKIHRAA